MHIAGEFSVIIDWDRTCEERNNIFSVNERAMLNDGDALNGVKCLRVHNAIHLPNRHAIRRNTHATSCARVIISHIWPVNRSPSGPGYWHGGGRKSPAPLSLLPITDLSPTTGNGGADRGKGRAMAIACW